MTESGKAQAGEAGAETSPGREWLAGCEPLVSRLYARSGAARWKLGREKFSMALEKSARWKFPQGPPGPREAEEYLGALHVEDLALACACAEGCEEAWEEFLAAHRGSLRRAAAALLRCGADSGDAIELADSIFADLYGWRESKAGRQPLIRWYNGRSKLSTWLRTVLAQRHVDSIRRSRRFDSLDEEGAEEAVAEGRSAAPAGAPGSFDPPDPGRQQYLELLSRGLNGAIRALAPGDRARLLDYYLSGRTLAEMAVERNEHEATASRKLERIRRELRTVVVRTLREPPGSLDEAQIALCFEYALEDWPFDLREALEEKSGP
jgi:RNA polymerase sigma factor (sigma-70 family)